MLIRTKMILKNEKGDKLTITYDYEVDIEGDGYTDEEIEELRAWSRGELEYMPDRIAEGHGEWQSDMLWESLEDTEFELIEQEKS